MCCSTTSDHRAQDQEGGIWGSPQGNSPRRCQKWKQGEKEEWVGVLHNSGLPMCSEQLLADHWCESRLPTLF